MNTFLWVSGENGILFALNYAFIESADKADKYTEVRMVSGQVIHIQESVQELMQMVPLYTHPPAPTTPLTDDAIADVVSSFDGNEDWNLHDFARAVLAAQEARNV